MKISVIIPVYNAESYLDRCIQSVLNQTYINWKLLLIDDGSTDGSLSILRKYEKIDSRISVIHQQNKGAGAARNLGIDSIKNEGYVVFIDSDDYIEPNYFELLVTHNEDVVFINVAQRDTSGKIIKKERMSSLYKKLDIEEIKRKQMTGCIPWGGVRKAVKSKLILSQNIRYSLHTIGEEAVFSFKVLFYANSIGFINYDVYNYMIRKNSLSTTQIDDPWGKVAENMENVIKELNVYEKYVDTLNAFYISACAVSLKRIVSYYSYGKYMDISKKRIKLLKRQLNTNYKIDKKNLNFKAKLIYVLILLNFRRIIFILGKIYN